MWSKRSILGKNQHKLVFTYIAAEVYGLIIAKSFQLNLTGLQQTKIILCISLKQGMRNPRRERGREQGCENKKWKKPKSLKQGMRKAGIFKTRNV